MKSPRVLLLGGTGFIGTAVAEHLAQCGSDITVPSRQPTRGQHLLVLPTCEVVAADIHDAATLDRLVAGKDVVINLIGTLHGDFQRIHVEFPRQVAMACLAHHVARLIHMSALGASESAPSQYLRSRASGESVVQQLAREKPAPQVTIFRPSVVFGEHDKFINMFARLAKIFPIIPLGSADATFQPVWVEDVARAIVTSLDRPETVGKTYSLVGPRTYTLRELVKFAAAIHRKRPWILGLGPMLSMLQARILQYLPGKLITPDNVLSMRVPNTSEVPFPAIFGLPHSLETVFFANSSLSAMRHQTRHQIHRQHAGRSSI